MNNKELTFMDALFTGNMSAAIERSEEREQQLTIKNQRIPIKANDHTVPREVENCGISDNMRFEEQFKIMLENNKKWTKEQYEKMGIKIIDEYDDLFLTVSLPDGWEVKATDHNMWNNIIDDKGRKRISFFYKGSFYDRDAFSNFNRRYTYSEVPFDNYETDASYEERRSKEWYGVIYDSDKEIFRTKGAIKGGYFDNNLNNECLNYLKENYPLWEDINAYWDN